VTIAARANVVSLEEARSRARPVHVEVQKSELVETFMDLDTLGTEAIDALYDAIQVAQDRLPRSPERVALQGALGDTYRKLKALVITARAGSARYESERPSR
jgi:hypothetical protein